MSIAQTLLSIAAGFVATAAFAAPAAPSAWDFEADTQGWQARAGTVHVERVAGPGAAAESRGCLHVSGSMAENWNYATCGAKPAAPGQVYRLSAWVRVDRLGAGTPVPYLKCEWEDAQGASLGRANTNEVDRARMGQWQRLSAEFRTPEGTAQTWLALEKGTEGPAEIDALLDDVRLEPIDHITLFDEFRLDPLPAPLQARRGAHPRLYLDAARVAELRNAIGGTHAALWEEVRALADRYAAAKPPAYRADPDGSGNEQLWQRSVGNAMPYLAIAYILTDDRKYLDGARAWALASCGYRTWGLGGTDGMDLAAGHQLFGLALIYDWCYRDLGDEARTTIRETLVRRTGAMFEAAATGKAWWRRSYLQNHLWVNICGMAAAGLALYDEVPDANFWIGLPLDKFRRTMATLGPDGASHEGVGYWGYGVEYMLKFMYLSRELLGVDLYQNDWWRNTAAYRQYLALPRDAWTARDNIVDIADCPRSNWYGPEYLLRGLAREFRDSHAQWLAQQVDEANVDSSDARWLNLIWYDPDVKPLPPADLPTLHRFDDLDIVSARSGWSGKESLVVFKCGPALGHHAAKTLTYDAGGGHVHPDTGHFVLFGAGEWLIRDDGYRAKWTSQHNTLLVDGKGQLGEGRQWFAAAEALKAEPRVTLALSTPGLDHIVGDAAPSYPRELGLKRFTRHILFLKPDTLIVADDIALDAPRPLDLLFHPEHPAARAADGTYLAPGRQSVLRIEPLTLDGVTVTAGEESAADRHGAGGDKLFAVRLHTERREWRSAVAFTWSAAGAEPARVTLDAAGDTWVFRSGGRSVTLDWATGPGGDAGPAARAARRGEQEGSGARVANM